MGDVGKFARLARADYVPAFPITPQTEIIETLSQWIDAGDMPGRLVTLDSEHSMVTAAGAAAAGGADRVAGALPRGRSLATRSQPSAASSLGSVSAW